MAGRENESQGLVVDPKDAAESAGLIQATGRDARRRTQYKYHPQFREVRESTKFEHMMGFARAAGYSRHARRAHGLARPAA